MHEQYQQQNAEASKDPGSRFRGSCRVPPAPPRRYYRLLYLPLMGLVQDRAEYPLNPHIHLLARYFALAVLLQYLARECVGFYLAVPSLHLLRLAKIVESLMRHQEHQHLLFAPKL